MPFYNPNTAESLASMSNDDAERRFAPMEQPTPDVSDQSSNTASNAQILPSRMIASQDTTGSNSPPLKAIRYEDTVEEATEIDSPRRSPDSNFLYRSRALRTVMKSGAKTEMALSHIAEDFDAEHQSTSAYVESKTPKKDSPTFTSKRNSISGSFNVLKRAGTKLVRRGVQGVLPVTPSKKSEPALIKTPDVQEDVFNNESQATTPLCTIESLSYDDPYDDTPRDDTLGCASLAGQAGSLHRQNESDETERTFYDAQETFTPAITTTTANLAATIAATELSEASDNVSQRHYPPKKSSRPAILLTQEQYSARVPSQENIVTGINKRQSSMNVLEDVDYASRRSSRSSLISSQGLREVGSQETANNIQDVLLEIEAGGEAIVDIVQATLKESGAPKNLFDLVKEQLRQPDDDVPTTVDELMKVMRISTKDVNFKNAQKNFFPLWASSVKKNGRSYTQDEVVNVIVGSI